MSTVKRDHDKVARSNYQRLAIWLVVIAILCCVAVLLIDDRRWDTMLAAMVGGILSAAAAIFTAGLAMSNASVQLQEEMKAERQATREAKWAALRTEIGENILQLRRKEPTIELHESEWAPLSDAVWNSAREFPNDLETATILSRAYIAVRKYNRALQTHFDSKVAKGGGMGPVPLQR